MLVVLLASIWGRVASGLGDPQFDRERPEGLLKSDPALLYHLTSEILAAGGGVPASWEADRRIQHPFATDVTAEFTVGQEFLLAWTQAGLEAVLGRAPPLHVTAVWLFSVLAALAGLGVFGLAYELTRRHPQGLLASGLALGLWALLPANYRTVGFVLVREDLSLTALALSLWAVARAARAGSAVGWALAGLPLAVALSTWHAQGFFLAVLLGAPLLWLGITGDSVLAARERAWVLLAPLAAALLVPALRAAGALGSLPALLGATLLLAGLAQRKGARHGTRLAVGLGGSGVLLALSQTLRSGSGPGSYAHVRDVLIAKLRFLGRPPADPTEISFDARLLWQGPFETLDLRGFAFFLGLSLLFAVLAVGLALAGLRAKGAAKASRSDPGGVGRAEALLALAALLSLPAAWLVARVVVLPGLLLPAVAGVAFVRIRSRAAALGLGAVLLLQQAFAVVPWLHDFQSAWYQPPGRQAEIEALVDWVGANVPVEEPIATDFMNGPALLAHCGNPIVLQPKYETDRSRRQAERFLTTFFQGSPAEFLKLVTKEFDCRYLVIDRYTLGYLSRWTAGLREGEPLVPGSAAELFLSQDEARLSNVSGTRLVYRSPEGIRQSNGAPYDFFRVYVLGE